MPVKNFEGDFGFFSAAVHGAVLEIRFRENLLEHLASLSKRDIITDMAKQVLKSDDIKVILLNSDFKNSGCESYTKFFLEKSREKEMIDIHRLYNVTSKFILGLINMDRIAVHACSGNVIALFLNISLACDYRIAAASTVFCNPYIDLGMIPLGGGPYFLSKMTGKGNAWETLLLKKDISAAGALDLGLVDMVVHREKLDSEAMTIAQKFADNDIGTIRGLKKLINFSHAKDLEQYFEKERDEINRILMTSTVFKGPKDA